MKILYKILALTGICALISTATYAQLNPLAAQYYSNRYLINPAFAGTSEGLKVDGAIRKLWSNIPGSPVTQSLTSDYGFSRVGIGLNVNNESAGLFRQTRVVGSYAYHLPLNEQQQLHFGLSAGFTNRRLESSDINGDPNDPLIGQYNNRKTYLDGDFGIAYTSSRLSIEVSIPNLKSFFKRDDMNLTDVATFYSAVSYKIKVSEDTRGIDLEPKIAYRGVKGFDNIWDAGAQAWIANQQAFIMGMYHSSESATFGLGMDFRRKYLIGGMYTTQNSALTGYTNGSFELNLRVRLF